MKIIPHVDGSPRICELVEYYLEEIDLKGAWTGPGALDLHAHALAPARHFPSWQFPSVSLTSAPGLTAIERAHPFQPIRKLKHFGIS